MDYQDLVNDELRDLVNEAMSTPQNVYFGGIEDLTQYSVYIGKTAYTLDNALILAAIENETDPVAAFQILELCAKKLREELSRALLREACENVDDRLGANQPGPAFDDDFAGAMA